MTGGRGPFVSLGEGPVEDDPFSLQPGSATIDDHGHTAGDSQGSSMMAVSAPLIPAGPGRHRLVRRSPPTSHYRTQWTWTEILKLL